MWPMPREPAYTWHGSASGGDVDIRVPSGVPIATELTRDVVRVNGGVRIHYRRAGRGPAMILLHGYPQTGHMWRKVMPALAERFTVVAPDLRGYGDSDRPIAGYDKRTMAADVADVIRTLAIEPVVLVGHDRARASRIASRS